MAEDPRGLSGAVFRPTPLRDFTKDLAYKQQTQAKKRDDLKNFLDEYGVEIPTGVPATYQPSVFKLVEDYKGNLTEFVRAKQSGDNRKAAQLKSKLTNQQAGLKNYVDAAKKGVANAEGINNWMGENIDNLGEEERQRWSGVMKRLDQPLGEANFTEEGYVRIGDKGINEYFGYVRPMDKPEVYSVIGVADEIYDPSEFYDVYETEEGVVTRRGGFDEDRMREQVRARISIGGEETDRHILETLKNKKGIIKTIEEARRYVDKNKDKARKEYEDAMVDHFAPTVKETTSTTREGSGGGISFGSSAKKVGGTISQNREVLADLDFIDYQNPTKPIKFTERISDVVTLPPGKVEVDVPAEAKFEKKDESGEVVTKDGEPVMETKDVINEAKVNDYAVIGGDKIAIKIKYQGSKGVFKTQGVVTRKGSPEYQSLKASMGVDPIEYAAWLKEMEGGTPQEEEQQPQEQTESYTIQGESYTKEELLGAGWSESQIQQLQ